MIYERKNDELNFVKIKNSCLSKESFGRIKRQARLKKRLENHSSEKVLIFGICKKKKKNLSKLTTKKKMADDLNRYFTKEDIWMADQSIDGWQDVQHARQENNLNPKARSQPSQHGKTPTQINNK
jgi:hypothetical protein